MLFLIESEYSDQPYFTDEEAELERVSDLLRVTQLLSAGTSFRNLGSLESCSDIYRLSRYLILSSLALWLLFFSLLCDLNLFAHLLFLSPSHSLGPQGYSSGFHLTCPPPILCSQLPFGVLHTWPMGAESIPFWVVLWCWPWSLAVAVNVVIIDITTTSPLSDRPALCKDLGVW